MYDKSQISQQNYKFKVPQDDINFELPEPLSYYQQDLNFDLKVIEAKKNKIEPNIFKDAQFWFTKGHIIQTHGKISSSEVSKDSKKEN